MQGQFSPVDPPGTIPHLGTPAHAAGRVDLVATDAHGRSVVLAGAYTYAPPETFEFNGNWSGFSVGAAHTFLGVVVRDNMLVSITCDVLDVGKTLTFSPRPTVKNGEFSYTGSDGVAVSGRIASASEVVGDVDFHACSDSFTIYRQP